MTAVIWYIKRTKGNTNRRLAQVYSCIVKAMRAEGRRVELLLMDCGADQNDYVLYAGRMHLKTVLFISGTGEITEVNP